MKIVILKSKSFPNKQVILTRLYIHTYMKNWYFMHNFGPLVDYSKKKLFQRISPLQNKLELFARWSSFV